MKCSHDYFAFFSLIYWRWIFITDEELANIWNIFNPILSLLLQLIMPFCIVPLLLSLYLSVTLNMINIAKEKMWALGRTKGYLIKGRSQKDKQRGSSDEDEVAEARESCLGAKSGVFEVRKGRGGWVDKERWE